MTDRPIIHADALDDRLGYVGTAGSGKTYNAAASVERLLDSGARCVIVDPLDVWWGLRLMADGKTSSPYNVVIVGGQHADLPLNEHAGALIGDAVATSAESFIVSLGSLGTKAAERRFMLAFLTALYRHVTGEPLHLIFDEADLWAPQHLRDKEGEAAKLLGQMETMVRRGRIKGFIPWLITQRPAVLSKDVLSQVDGLVAFKLTSSQDRDAIGDWVQGQADKQQWKDIWASLPTMQRGQGIVWVPGRGILKTVAFPPKRTFDSSATPRRGEAKRTASLKPLNVEALKGRLETVAKEAEANDPKRLRGRIAELERELRVRPQSHEKAAIDHARAEGHRDGHAEGYGTGVAAMMPLLQGLIENGESWLGIAKTALGEMRDLARAAPIQIAPKYSKPIPPPQPSVRSAPSHLRRINGTGGATRVQRAFLTALAQRGRPLSRNKIAVFSGYSVKSRHVDNTLASLRSAGWAVGSGDAISITPDGLSALGAYDALPTGEALRQFWLGELDVASRAFLSVLIEHYPNTLTRNDLAEAAGYSVASRHVDNTLARLRSLELAEGRGDAIKATDELFE